MRTLLIFTILVVAGCAEQHQPDPNTPAANDPSNNVTKPLPTTPATSESSEPTPSTPVAASGPRDAGTPALSSPNPRASATGATNPNEAEPPRATDPHTKAVERIAILSRSCYERNVGNVDGVYSLELTMGPEGKIKQTLVKATEGGTVNAGFERCIVDALSKQNFPALASNESIVQIPLQFKKNQSFAK